MKVSSVFLDLDGTALHDDKTISDRLINIINNLKKEKNINFYVSTGRSYESASSYVKKLGLEDVIISYNGARVLDIQKNKLIKESFLPKETVEKLIKISREYKIHLNLYNNDRWYVEKEDDESLYYSNLTDIKWNLINFNDYLGKISTKGLFIADLNILKDLKKVLEKELLDVEYVFSSDYYLEVLKKGVNKGSAVKDLIGNKGFLQEETIAFGDHWNDYEMLKYVKYPCLMGNAPDDLKKEFLPNEIIKTNNEDGVALVLEKLI